MKAKKVKLFQRHPVSSPRQNLAFTGKGFAPDHMTEGKLTQFPEACSTMLEGGHILGNGVLGRDSMMPPAGNVSPVQKGQKVDNGAAGSGSFVTRPATGAKHG